MTTLKFIGFLLILAAGGGAAALSVRTERRRLEVLDGWIDLIAYVRSRIDCFLMPQDAILASCGRELILRCGGTLPCHSFSALARAAERHLTPEGARLIGAFTHGIGSGYREEQVCACDYYIDALREIRKKQAEALPARLRVRVALCLTAALGAAILLW